MSGPHSANIHSVDSLKDVRAALILFHERSITAMGDLRQKIDRTVSWLQLDRPNYWRDQERRAFDSIATTRVAYDTCRLRTVAGRRSDCIEEKKALERAKRRMEYVREKQVLVRKWMSQSEREASEYRSRTSGFQRMLENDVPLMIAQLGRMIDAVEGYLEGHSAASSTAPLSGATNSGSAATLVESTDSTSAEQDNSQAAAAVELAEKTSEARTDRHE